jgi:hypothetical protein
MSANGDGRSSPPAREDISTADRLVEVSMTADRDSVSSGAVTLPLHGLTTPHWAISFLKMYLNWPALGLLFQPP